MSAILSLLLLAAGPPGSSTLPVPRVTKGTITTEFVPEVPAPLAEKLERYLNVRRADLLGWDHAGTGLFILTRFGNVNELHRVDAPLGMRRQITFVAEGIDGFAPSPDPARPGGLVVMDTGGSENAQLLWIDRNGGEMTLLTDGTSRNGAPVWSKDGKRVAYHSTRRNSKDFDIYTFDAAEPKKPHAMIYEASGQWSPLDWAPAGDALLVLHEISETKNELHVLTPGKGLTAQIDPKPGSDVAINAAVFGPGGTSVFYLSDAGGEYRGLWQRDLKSGKDTLLSGDVKWDFESLVASPDRKLLAVTVNEHGWSRLKLYDVGGKKFRADPKLPPAIINGLDFSRDGRRLALSIEGGRNVGDIHVLDLTSTVGKIVRWTESEVGGLDPAKFHDVARTEYPTFDGKKIPAFIVKPSGPGPFPVVVSIHGGPEAQARPYFSSFYEYIVSELGYAVVIPNVRGSTGYGRTYTLLDNGEKREDSVKDIGALFDWIATQPDLDKSKVAVYGGSYGGFMVLATGAMYPDKVSAIVDVVGISNFVTFLESTKEYRRDLRRVEYGDERLPAMRTFLQKISPTENVAKIRAPLFVVQGANDPRVPVTEAEQMVRSVRKTGKEVWYMVASDEGHGFQKKGNRDAFVAATVMFLQKALSGGK